MSAVAPLPFGFFPEHEFATYDISFYDEAGEEDYLEVVDKDSIYSFIAADISRVIYGQFLNAHSLS